MDQIGITDPDAMKAKIDQEEKENPQPKPTDDPLKKEKEGEK